MLQSALNQVQAPALPKTQCDLGASHFISMSYDFFSCQNKNIDRYLDQTIPHKVVVRSKELIQRSTLSPEGLVHKAGLWGGSRLRNRRRSQFAQKLTLICYVILGP